MPSDKRSYFYLDVGLSGHRFSYIAALVDSFTAHHAVLHIILPASVCETTPLLCKKLESISQNHSITYIQADWKSDTFMDLLSEFLCDKQGVLLQTNGELLAERILKGWRPPAGIQIDLLMFKPFLHYPFFKEHLKYRCKNPNTRSLVKQYLFYKKLSQADFIRNVYFIDPFAVKWFKYLFPAKSFYYIPDIIEPLSSTRMPREMQNIEFDTRKVLLLPGSLDHRKSIPQILAALSHLVEIQKSKKSDFVLILSGSIDPSFLPQLKDLLRKAQDSIDVILIDRFLDFDELEYLYTISSAVFALYHNFIGMSGIAMNSAHRSKTLLVSNAGPVPVLLKTYPYLHTANPLSKKSLQKELVSILRAPKHNPSSDWVAMNPDDTFAESLASKVLAA